MTQNLYEILGINSDATPEEIKKAYRELSKIHHPDVGGDEEEFKKISEAYTILMDDGARQHYEDFGCGPDSEEAQHMLIVVNSLCIVWDHIAEELTPGQLEKYDLIGMMQNAIKIKIGQVEKQLANTNLDMQKLVKFKEVLKSRLKRKKGVKPTPNFFIGTIEKRIVIIEQNIKAQEQQLRVAKDMYNIINEYDFDFEDADPFNGQLQRIQLKYMDAYGNRPGGFK